MKKREKERGIWFEDEIDGGGGEEEDVNDDDKEYRKWNEWINRTDENGEGRDSIQTRRILQQPQH